MYGSWDMKRDRQNFFFILGHFFPFYPTNNLKNQNREKMKKTPGDIIILHLRTRNDDHMLYCSWDMAHNKIKFLFFTLGYFFPFTPLTAQNIKIFIKWKKCLELSSFYTGVPKIMIIWSTVPEIWWATDRWTGGQTDGQMDRWMNRRTYRWTEKVKYRGGYPT